MNGSTRSRKQWQEQERKNSLPWTDIYTDLLLSSGNGTDTNDNRKGSFILLENVMDSLNEGGNFCDCLRRELSFFLDKLKPSRTQGEVRGDHRADEILELLQSMGTQLSDHQNHQQVRANGSDRIRGDKSLFVSREYRHRECFAARHPYLHKLITTISNTFDREFDSTKLRFDFSMTSVQLALYPGDSESGYRRHCDRQNSCMQEQINEAKTKGTKLMSPNDATQEIGRAHV